jgi:hypothetical protein
VGGAGAAALGLAANAGHEADEQRQVGAFAGQAPADAEVALAEVLVARPPRH